MDVKEVRRIARRRAERPAAQQAVDPTSVYRGCFRRWRQEISVTLQMGNSSILGELVTLQVGNSSKTR